VEDRGRETRGRPKRKGGEEFCFHFWGEERKGVNPKWGKNKFARTGLGEQKNLSP